MYAATVTGSLTQKPVRTRRKRYIFSMGKEHLHILELSKVLWGCAGFRNGLVCVKNCK
jgi:hypothetical protein